MIDKVNSKNQKGVFSSTYFFYYTSAIAISTLFMGLLGILAINHFNALENTSMIIIVVTPLYFLQILTIACLYPFSVPNFNVSSILASILTIIYLHKLILSALGSIGGYVVNGLYYSISIICLAPVAVSYFINKSFTKTSLYKGIIYGILIILIENIFNAILYFSHYKVYLDAVNTLEHTNYFTPDPFSPNSDLFLTNQIAFLSTYILSVLLFFFIYPKISVGIRQIHDNHTLIFSMLKWFTFVAGIIPVFLLLIFA